MIFTNLSKQLQDAMKAKDEVRLSTLKMLKSALSYAQIDAQHELSDEEELKVVRSEAKKRHDAIEAYEKGNRQELADREKAELAILEEFLPTQLSDENLIKIIDEVVSDFDNPSMSDMGKIMGAVNTKVAGQADGSRIAPLVKQKLIG